MCNSNSSLLVLLQGRGKNIWDRERQSFLYSREKKILKFWDLVSVVRVCLVRVCTCLVRVCLSKERNLQETIPPSLENGPIGRRTVLPVVSQKSSERARESQSQRERERQLEFQRTNRCSVVRCFRLLGRRGEARRGEEDKKGRFSTLQRRTVCHGQLSFYMILLLWK